MFSNVPGDIKLWSHQRQGLEFLVAHLQSRTHPDPCLIRMPTGTGKTGVIACASLISSSGRTLVLTPWSNLRDQMIEALKEDFWRSIGRKPPAGPIVDMVPSTAKEVLKKPEVKVIVCTFATLTELRRETPALYEDLAAFIGMVIVDECHYEPAIEWGKSVKGLGKATVLLTATPYRNDLKLFRIRDVKAGVFQYTHDQAERERIVRTLDVQPLQGTDIASLSKAFIAKWKALVNKGKLASKSPRAIICCASAADIRSVVTLLNSEKLKAIGIHETFAGTSRGDLMKEVPSTGISADIWVHQNKLTEGLDDHRFCCLAFFCQINNDRKLVQQIGRVLRTSTSDRAGVPALMLAPPEYRLEERWSAYREFEKDADLQSAERFRDFVDKMLSEQPPVEYFDGRFRRRFRTDILGSNPQVVIAPSVLIREVGSGFKMAEYIEDCTDTLNLTDAIILGKPNEPCVRSPTHALWVYASMRNSRLLLETSLYEVRLEAHCAVLAGNHLLVSDTTGTYPDGLLEASTRNLGAAELSRLLDASYRVTNVSVGSAIPFDTVLRTSEHRGHNLASIPSSLTDRIQICRAARGASKHSRRYLGLQRGRVREELPEQARRRHSTSEFQEWANAIGDAVASTRRRASHPVLQRYMQPAKPPTSPIPVSLAIDLSQPSIQVTNAAGTRLEISASSVAVEPKKDATTPQTFECIFTFSDTSRKPVPIELKVTVEYQARRGRFWFKSEGSGGVHVQDTDDGQTQQRNLVDFLNQNQELVLIGLEGGELVYQGRNFYEIDYAYAERVLLDHISQSNAAPCGNEKGTTAQIDRAKRDKSTNFIPGSLFRVIADRKLPLPFSPEVVICDDLGSECADFVLANFTTKHMALVHAKGGGGAGISASAFHDVVAQAMKNLVYLSRNAEQPSGAPSWTSTTLWNNTGVPRLFRKPAGTPEGTALWAKLRSEIIDSADARLHVVLATTGCCDLSALKAAVADKKDRTAETAQLFHLLDGLIGYARQLGVSVSIVDVPFLVPVKSAP